MITGLIYMGIPSLYLICKLPEFSKKCIVESAVLTIPMVFIIDYIGHVSKVWYESSSEIGVRLFNVIPIETFIWGFIYLYFIIIFYEYFFDRSKVKRFSKNFKKELILFIALLFGFLIVLVLNNNLLIINHFYIYLSLGFFLIVFIGFLRYPKLFNKIVLTEIFLFIPWIIHEIISLESHHWIFTGNNYLGYIQIFQYQFPLEELWWLIIVVPAVLLWHEYFVDNCK